MIAWLHLGLAVFIVGFTILGLQLLIMAIDWGLETLKTIPEIVFGS